jgi:hypothetical protein
LNTVIAHVTVLNEFTESLVGKINSILGGGFRRSSEVPVYIWRGIHMADENGWTDRDDKLADEEAQAFAEKFNISLDKAKRLIELHRAVLAREVKKPKKR